MFGKGTYQYDPYKHPHLTQVGCSACASIGNYVGAAPTFGPPSQENINREMYAAAVSKAVYDWTNELNAIIENRMSWTSVLNRGLLFVPQAYRARETLIRSKDKLNKEFLPIALNAIRDYNKSLDEVKNIVVAYLKGLEQNVGISLKITEQANLSTAVNTWLKNTQEALEEKTPWWVYLVVGLSVSVAGAYVIRSVR